METYVVNMRHPFVEPRTFLITAHNVDEAKKVASAVYKGWEIASAQAVTDLEDQDEEPDGGIGAEPVTFRPS